MSAARPTTPRRDRPRELVAALLLFAGGAAALSPLVSAPLALAAGVLLALTIGNPWSRLAARWAGTLLRACVIGLGFGMSLAAVADAAAQGLAYTVVGVFAAFAGGLLLGRLLHVERHASLLVASGTSICGGSAIAAVGSAIRARTETMGATLGVVFILNAIALYAFPALGRAIELSQTQFAIWAAVAIHDTSSVVAAAAVYGPQALEEATVLKLARTLWLIPLVLGAAWWARRQSHSPAATARTPEPAQGDVAAVGVDAAPATPVRVQFPWFPLLFLLAVLARSAAPAALEPILDTIARAARATLPLVLFMIGSSLTIAALRRLGARTFVQATVLWLVMAGAVLAAVLAFSG